MFACVCIYLPAIRASLLHLESGPCCSLTLRHNWILIICVRVRGGCVTEVGRRGRCGDRVNKHTVEAVLLKAVV